MADAVFRFYAELRDFLRPEHRGGTVAYGFERPPSLKHAIEALGVPHTEVDLILVNGVSASFSRTLEDRDRVSVYPVFESIDIASVTAVRPTPLRELRFVLDCHLGRLAKYLRLLGFDTLYERHCADEDLARTAVLEKRVLLTMDRGLLKRSLVERGYLVRAVLPRRQLTEVLRRFDLAGSLKPFERCLCCNTALEAVDKDMVRALVPPRTRARCDEFQWCPRCRKPYRKGSHYAHLRLLIDAAARA